MNYNNEVEVAKLEKHFDTVSKKYKKFTAKRVDCHLSSRAERSCRYIEDQLEYYQYSIRLLKTNFDEIRQKIRIDLIIGDNIYLHKMLRERSREITKLNAACLVKKA